MLWLLADPEEPSMMDLIIADVGLEMLPLELILAANAAAVAADLVLSPI